MPVVRKKKEASRRSVRRQRGSEQSVGDDGDESWKRNLAKLKLDPENVCELFDLGERSKLYGAHVDGDGMLVIYYKTS